MKKYRHKKISEMERLVALGGEELIPCVSGSKNKAMESGLIKAAVLDDLEFIDLGTINLPRFKAGEFYTAEVGSAEHDVFLSIAQKTSGYSGKLNAKGFFSGDFMFPNETSHTAFDTQIFNINRINNRTSSSFVLSLLQTDSMSKNRIHTEVINLYINDVSPDSPVSYFGYGTKKTLNLGDDSVVDFTSFATKTELFDDMWRVDVGVWGDIDHSHYEDGVNKPYYLNELWLTYGEAVNIHIECIGINSIGSDKANCFSPYPYRTALPIQRRSATDASGLFNNSPNLEVVSFFDKDNIPFIVNRWDEMFHRCPKLHTINGVIDVSKANIVGSFLNCQALREIRIRGVVKSFSIQYSPLLSLESVDYMVMNAANTSEITITVHPDVYAKLTDESNTEWYQVFLDAIEKNITFATTD